MNSDQKDSPQVKQMELEAKLIKFCFLEATNIHVGTEHYHKNGNNLFVKLTGENSITIAVIHNDNITAITHCCQPYSIEWTNFDQLFQ
ncbi:MAG: hypothetical protein AABY32_01955 [Nanoarchaeota archaeon]